MMSLEANEVKYLPHIQKAYYWYATRARQNRDSVWVINSSCATTNGQVGYLAFLTHNRDKILRPNRMVMMCVHKFREGHVYFLYV